MPVFCYLKEQVLVDWLQIACNLNGFKTLLNVSKPTAPEMPRNRLSHGIKILASNYRTFNWILEKKESELDGNDEVTSILRRGN